MLGAARLIDVPERLSAKVFYCPEILLHLRTDYVILIHCDKVKCKTKPSRLQKRGERLKSTRSNQSNEGTLADNIQVRITHPIVLRRKYRKR